MADINDLSELKELEDSNRILVFKQGSVRPRQAKLSTLTDYIEEALDLTGTPGGGTDPGATLSSTDELPEGASNRYFTEDRARSASLGNLPPITDAPIVSGDQIVQAAAKAQGQIAAIKLALDDKVNANVIGQPNGIAPLSADGRIASVYLPAGIDAIQEYANIAAFPGTGVTGVIYIALNNGKQYRWSGTQYTEIVASPGSTDAVPEGSSNLYFLASRVRAAVLTGFGTLTNAAVTATDSVLAAFEKLQGQVNALIAHAVSTNNPHAVNSTQVGLGNVANLAPIDLPLSNAAIDALAGKISSANAALTGASTAETPPTSDNSTRISTTAYMQGQASNAVPLMDGTANAGNVSFWARGNHVHPTDTSRAPVLSPAFTGIPTAPTAAETTNTTQLATTAMVQAVFNRGTPSTGILTSSTPVVLSLAGRFLPAEAYVILSAPGAATVLVEDFVAGPGWRAVAPANNEDNFYKIFQRPGEAAPTQVRFTRTAGSATNTAVGILGNAIGGLQQVAVPVGNIDGGSPTSNYTGLTALDGGTP